ncbi:MAG TPA: RelA/SpoT domain-containing protein [Thermoanaerobaculia bacterium]|nr:RelA/SpoT domain-containing protein [Thermoanaerobaculia bacterium]
MDSAGQTLASEEASALDRANALEVLGNWRTAHSFALNSMQLTLRKRAAAVCQKPLIAQRLKRVSSIVAKLRRFPKMNLSRMQDIAGCRAIVDTVDEVRCLEETYKTSRQKHKLVNEKDYITSPQPSGYRGIHLIYKFESAKSADHTGRLIEVQIRSRLQHAWATAVETVGTFVKQSLKASQGSDDWLRFFSLAASLFAIREGCPTVPDTPEYSDELQLKTRNLFDGLKADTVLSAYSRVIQVFEQKKMNFAYYFLLELRPAEGRLMIESFRRTELGIATKRYLDRERAQDGNSQTVLVVADSIKALKQAYPNYFLDTHEFIKALKSAIGRG